MTGNRSSIWATLYKYKFHHVLLWACYYIFWTLMYQKYFPSIWGIIVIVTVYFVFIALSFYTTAYYLFPRYLYKQKFGAFILIFGLMTLLLSFGQGYTLYFIYKDIQGIPTEYKDITNMTQFSFASLITMVGLLSGAKIIVEKIKNDRINRIRDKQRLESELQYLKAQVNPHFLFNAINSVYFLIKKDQNLAAETLIKLSDLLRFQLYDCIDEKIAIEKEIEYLKNFITLEKIRKGEKVNVKFELDGNLSGFEISPFMVIPFVENAFKHVSNFSDGSNVISITMRRVEDQLHVNVENTTEKTISTGVGGIGLKNVKRRLELLYPETHQLSIREDHDKYYVHLSLKIS